MTGSRASRIPPKPVALFALQAIALTWLIGQWPTPRALYPAAFHAQANALLSHGPEPRVRFASPAAGAIDAGDTTVTGYVEGVAQPVWISQWSSIRVGYWPSAVLVALILATPMTARRRIAALLAGLVVVDVVSLGRVGVMIAYAFYEYEHGPGGSVRGPGHLLLRIGAESLTATIPGLVIVLVVWVVVARPREVLDLSVLRRVLGPGAGAVRSGRSSH